MQLEILLQEMGHDSRGQIYKKTMSLVMLLMQQLILDDGNISVVRFMENCCAGGGLCFCLSIHNVYLIFN